MRTRKHAALTANPSISAARLLALAADQQTRETRAGLLPTITGSLTAVDTHENSRITAGALNNPIVYNRAAAGFTGSALLTDFGRTRDLIRAAHLRADAASQNARATAADILLAVDTAFFQALAAQTQAQVAQQNVATSTQGVEQIKALTEAKLRSTLDLSFANVNLSQARLQLLDAQNARAAALNGLNALMGRDTAADYSLVQPSAAPAPPPASAEPLVQQALTARPDLQSLRTQTEAAQQFSQAEHKLQLPTITALGATGIAPVRDDHILTSWYGAAGVNLSVPVFNAFSTTREPGRLTCAPPPHRRRYRTCATASPATCARPCCRQTTTGSALPYRSSYSRRAKLLRPCRHALPAGPQLGCGVESGTARANPG